MASIRTWLKWLFFGDNDQTSRSEKAQHGQTQGATATEPQGTATLTQASHAERAAAWADRAHLSHEEQLHEWTQQMDSWFANLHADPTTWDQYACLQRLLGGDTNEQPHAPVVVSAQALYHTFFTGEGNGDIEYFFQRIVRTNTVEQIHRNQELIENLAKMYGEETATGAYPRIAALTEKQKQPSHTLSTAPLDYTKLFSTLGTDVLTGQDVIISQAERQLALACFGAIGSGKSTLAWHLISQDIRQNMGVVLVEPHGDLTRAVLAGIPDSDLHKVVYLDLTDCATFPFSINPFQCDNLEDAAEVAKVANFVFHTFSRVWNIGTETPRLSMVLRNVTRTLIENPGSSFADIPLLFHDAAAREKLVKNIKSPHTKLWWEQYNSMSPRERRELIASTENKIDSYLNEPLIANVLSQAQSTIDFAQLLNDGNIVLINLSPQLEEISNLLGSLIIGRILMAAYQRASIPESQRIQCNVYIDEWSRFCSDDVSVLIAESRKFKVIIGGLFNQTLETISDSNRATALQAGTLVAFRVSAEDAKVLCGSYNASPTPEQTGVEPIRAPVTDIVSHLVRRGHTNPVITAFVTDYLMPLDTLIKSSGPSSQEFVFGCTLFQSSSAIKAQQLLNECLFKCMQSGRADGFIPPLVLFTLGGAADPGITYVFYDDIKRDPFYSGYLFLGLSERANCYGHASFLNDPEAVAKLLKKHAKRRLYNRVVTPGPSLMTMLKRLRETMEILAKEPVLVDTGQYRAVFRQRTYTDMSAQIANELSQQDNFTARVKTLRGEYTIRTNPMPTLMSEAQLNARIGEIKRRMRVQGLCRPAHEVEEEVRIRHERLRQRNDAPPPPHTNGNRRRRNRPHPPDHA